MESPLTTTFGIEIEFVGTYRPSRYTDLAPLRAGRFWDHNTPCSHEHLYGYFIRSEMITMLRDAGFPVNDIGDDPVFTKWTIDTDDSIDTDLDNPYIIDADHFGLELKTPAYLWKDQKWALNEVKRAVNLLDDKFALFTNNTCGLHVHVGNGTSSLPLHVLKSLATLVTVFEGQFESVHPDHRIGNIHCRSPQANFKRWRLTDVAEQIWGADNVEELVEYMSSCSYIEDRAFAYNFSNLVNDKEINTVEFRQHEATLNPQVISAWTLLVCHVVEKCYEFSQVDLQNFVAKHINDSTYSMIQLLLDLDLLYLADYYYWQKGLYPHERTSVEDEDKIDEATVEWYRLQGCLHLLHEPVLEEVEEDAAEGVEKKEEVEEDGAEEVEKKEDEEMVDGNLGQMLATMDRLVNRESAISRL